MAKEEVPALAVGNDSGICKADFVGDARCAIFPSIVGEYNMPGIMFGMDQTEQQQQ